ncbi:MAG: retroviral-like aspartic protease [Chloroflexota bacterium]
MEPLSNFYLNFLSYLNFAYPEWLSTDNLLTSLMPRLSLVLSNGNRSVEVLGLLDTGAAVNVLPYGIGLALGAVWEEQKFSVPLVGSLGRYEARGIAVFASHPQLNPSNPVRLVCVDKGRRCACVVWSVEFLFGVRCVFLPFPECV